MPPTQANASWTACFDTSTAARKAYVMAVYGGSSAAAMAFDWRTVHVLFPQFLRAPGGWT